MCRKSWRFAALTALLAGLVVTPLQLAAQQTYKPLPVNNEAYVKPFAPLRIVGNLYYVGKYDPNRFVDTDGFLAKIQFYEKLYNAQLQREQREQRERQEKSKNY